jgi:NAD(P)-dependent dehydrogenase (short-subunit alcohol dehydrogenase family)
MPTRGDAGAGHSFPLSGRVAVVTGSSRGAGRAIARELGRLGATVYVTGRSSQKGGSTEGLPGTIEETAAEVTELGGRGVPVRVDHTVEPEVRALFERVRGEVRRLDILVNNAWGGYEQYDGPAFEAPFWEQPLEKRWNGMYLAGLRTQFMSSLYAAPLLVERDPAQPGRLDARLIVNTVSWAHDVYLGNLYYDVVKAATIRMVFGMSIELRSRNVAVVALAPGFMRTERVMAEHRKKPFDLGATESPAYVGRAVAALAADARVMEYTGKLVTAGDLAREYGFTDEDGRQPPAFRISES